MAGLRISGQGAGFQGDRVCQSVLYVPGLPLLSLLSLHWATCGRYTANATTVGAPLGRSTPASSTAAMTPSITPMAMP